MTTEASLLSQVSNAAKREFGAKPVQTASVAIAGLVGLVAIAANVVAHGELIVRLFLLAYGPALIAYGTYQSFRKPAIRLEIEEFVPIIIKRGTWFAIVVGMSILCLAVAVIEFCSLQYILRDQSGAIEMAAVDLGAGLGVPGEGASSLPEDDRFQVDPNVISSSLVSLWFLAWAFLGWIVVSIEVTRWYRASWVAVRSIAEVVNVLQATLPDTNRGAGGMVEHEGR